MARQRKQWADDDGRTIADMSGLDRSGRRYRDPSPAPQPVPEEPAEKKPRRPWEPQEGEFSREDQRVYVFAALRAALLIGLVFLAGIGLTIWALLALWR